MNSPSSTYPEFLNSPDGTEPRTMPPQLSPLRSRQYPAQSESSECTDNRMPPFLTCPSYRFASYSGMPMPTRAPEMTPTAPPTPAPAKAAVIGPTAIKGLRPGIASAPIPISHPKAPPRTIPVPAPADAPSGALVFFFVAKVARSRAFRKQHRDIGVPKSTGFQFVHSDFHAGERRMNAKYCRTLLCQDRIPL